MSDTTPTPEAANHSKATDTPPKTPPQDNLVSSQQKIVIHGRELHYTVTTGTILLKEEDDKEGHKPKAEFFFTAYTKNDVGDLHHRPLTFSFNGGPGSSSVWLHLGVLGPRRVPLNQPEGTEQLPPPYRVVDNEHTLLEATDLVFIDPIATGYSRMIPGEKVNPNEYHTYSKDIESVGEFIRLYTSRYQRWSSPKYLIGESYGTTRAAGLSGYLQNRHGLFLNGIMLISSVLQFQTLEFEPGNDLPYSLFLPTYAATAWYHGRLAANYQAMPLTDFLAEVQTFADTEYILALHEGARLDAVERAHIIERLAAYTGLSWAYLERTNLRINIHRFVKELLRDEGRTIGRFDSRLTGWDRDEAGEHHEQDPSFDIVHGVYTACLNDYLRTELGFASDLPYEILSFNVFPKWKYDKFENQYVNAAETLREAMTRNKFLKVFVGSGYYDLATPYWATEYTFDHLELKPELRGNVRKAYYEAGHMMYLHPASLAKLSADLQAFLASS